MQFLWKYIDDFVGKGFEWNVIAELMFYASATFVPMALPLAVLLSSLMTFGNLGENYELVAIKSSGISLQKMMRPLVVFIIMVSSGAFYFSNYILPKANLQFYSLLSDVRNKKPAVAISEGVFNSNIGNFVIKVGKKNPDGIGIEDVIIYDHSKKSGNTNVTVAKSGRMEMNEDKTFLILTLEDGVNYDENTSQRSPYDKYPQQVTSFSKEIQRIDLSEFSFKKSDNSFRRNNYQMLNVQQLVYFEDSLLTDWDTTLTRFISYSVNDLGFYHEYFSNKNTPDSMLYKAGNDQLVDSLNEIIEQQTVQERGVDSLIVAEVIVDSPTNKPSELELEQTQQKKSNIFTKINAQIPILKDCTKAIDTPVIAQLDSVFTFDTSLVLNDDLVSNFDSMQQVRIVVGALSIARNASYQSNSVSKRLEAKINTITKYKVEWHRKFTLSIACILLFFIGAPLGAIIRKGGLGMPMVISILMFVLYHVLTIIGEKSVKSQVLDPWMGMWLASLIYLPLGIFLTWKATTDAPLLDSEVWQKIFNVKGIINKIRNIKK